MFLVLCVHNGLLRILSFQTDLLESIADPHSRPFGRDSRGLYIVQAQIGDRFGVC